MTKVDSELKALNEVFADGEWELVEDWHKPGDETAAGEHREIKTFRDKSGKHLNNDGEPLHTFERPELVDGLPIHHIGIPPDPSLETD